MIKAVVFDFGNVISEPQDTTCYTRMSALCDLSEQAMMHSFWKYRGEYDRGTIRGVEMYRRVLSDNGIGGNSEELDALASRLLDEDLSSWFHVSKPVTDWAIGLQKAGYTLGILSNMPFDFLERYDQKIELFAKADVSIFSCNVDLIKPEPAIYQTLIERTGYSPDEIVFFDDLEVNVNGALDAGIHAFLWTGIEQGKKDFQSIATPSA